MGWSERLGLVGLGLWGVGALTVEAVSSAGMALCGAAVALEAGGWTRAEAWAWVRQWSALLAFLAWALLAPMLFGAPPTGTGVARLVDWLGVPVAAHVFLTMGPRQRRWLAYAWGGTVVTSCAVAALQHYGVWPPLESFAAWQWTGIPFARVYEPMPGDEGRYMAGGLLFHRLKFAHVGGLAVLTALAGALTMRGRDRVGAALIAVVAGVAVLLFPGARMASIAVALAAAAAWVLLAKNRRRAVLIASVGVVGLTAAVAAYAPARARFAQVTTADRQDLLTTGLRAIASSPWVGVGLGRFRPALFASNDVAPDVAANTGKAHNQLISVAAELGLPGVALFLWLLFDLGRRLSPRCSWGAAGALALVFFLGLSLGHDPLYQAQFSMALTLLLGLGVGASGKSGSVGVAREEPAESGA